MMKWMTRGWVVAVAALMAIGTLGAAPAQAQQIEGTDVRSARAAILESEAAGLSEQRHKWDYAASLYRAAANIREDGDPKAVHDMVYAGRLSYYLRDLGMAVRDLEAAAQHALAGGDVIKAAHIYTDAAWVAGKDGKTRNQRSLASRAQRLAESPLLTAADRLDVLGRFDRVVTAENQDDWPPQ